MSDEHLLIGAARANFERLPVVQEPGKDHKLSSVLIGGGHRDSVLVLSLGQLDKLREVAAASVTNRVELPFPGLKVDTYQGKGTRGTHEVWKLQSGKPRPEKPAILGGD